MTTVQDRNGTSKQVRIVTGCSIVETIEMQSNEAMLKLSTQVKFIRSFQNSAKP